MAELFRELWVNVARFFYETKNFELFLAIKNRHAQNAQDIKISLRMIEFLLTNYSMVHHVNYVLITKDNEREILEYDDPLFEQKRFYFIKNDWSLQNFNLRKEYEKKIDTYHKKLFDPCCRSNSGEKILFKGPQDITINTTLNQLLFFYWAISHGVIDWLMLNALKVKKEMKNEENAKKEARNENNKKYSARFLTLERKRKNIKNKDQPNIVIKKKVESWK